MQHHTLTPYPRQQRTIHDPNDTGVQWGILRQTICTCCSIYLVWLQTDKLAQESARSVQQVKPPPPPPQLKHQQQQLNLLTSICLRCGSNHSQRNGSASTIINPQTGPITPIPRVQSSPLSSIVAHKPLDRPTIHDKLITESLKTFARQKREPPICRSRTATAMEPVLRAPHHV